MDDPHPVAVANPGGASPFLLIGDHAGNVIPAVLGDLGLSAADRARHIAWDIGIAGLGAAMARDMDATFVRQVYSRLVVDCNRRPDGPDMMEAAGIATPGAVAPVSDGTPVPGNADLSAAARQARVDAIHAPYQAAIAGEVARRAALGRETILVALHSFTPALTAMGTGAGAGRPWHVGVLHHLGEPAFAHALIAALRTRPALCVGDNEPYRMDVIDHTVPRHAWPARLPYAEIEVRQDLIGDAAGQAEWASLLSAALAEARAAIR
jgi:predicted N-formylglutamate amidohydrolase